jgi:cytochrome c-type biogenesis protein CcmH
VTRRLAWLALGVVLLVALAIGVTDRQPRTADERARAIGEQVMCPACSGERVADSQAPVAVNIRKQIATRIDDGQSDREIKDALVAAYGERIELNPPRSGLAGVVWVLPVAALVASLAGLAVVFRRWRVAGEVTTTDEDRAAAERARSQA